MSVHGVDGYSYLKIAEPTPTHIFPVYNTKLRHLWLSILTYNWGGYVENAKEQINLLFKVLYKKNFILQTFEYRFENQPVLMGYIPLAGRNINHFREFLKN